MKGPDSIDCRREWHESYIATPNDRSKVELTTEYCKLELSVRDNYGWFVTEERWFCKEDGCWYTKLTIRDAQGTLRVYEPKTNYTLDVEHAIGLCMHYRGNLVFR